MERREREKKSIADARRAKQNKEKETNEKILVNEASRPKEKNKEINEKIYTNKTSEAKKENKNEELDTTKQKLMRHYQSQDKL
ncbi:hypothetical protein RFI_35909, partial [Reticulomyxa filosa]